jgi:small subunit ribosomal protein S30e
VAKQDKKKKPRGRAHKRMQYNRRFVTAGNLSLPFIYLNI